MKEGGFTDQEESKQEVLDFNENSQESADAPQSTATVLVFILRNFSSRSQTIELRWKAQLRDKCNVRLPINDLPTNVQGKHDKIILRLTKLRPMEDWGPVESCFDVEIRDN